MFEHVTKRIFLRTKLLDGNTIAPNYQKFRENRKENIDKNAIKS